MYARGSVRLPLLDGREATLSGLCLDKITANLPKYSLNKLAQDIRVMCRDDGDGDLWKSLSKLPRIVGGQTDILIGLKYKKYFPQQIHMFPSGLTVYRSLFEGSDGAIGVIGGPHPEFTNAARHHRATNWPIDQHRKRFWLECEVPLVGYKTLTN